MPILTRYLSPGQYGMISIYGVFVGIIGVIIGFSTITAFIKIYFDRDYDRKAYLSTSIFISFMSVIIVFVMVFFSANFISRTYGIPISWLYAGVVFVFFNNIISVQTLLFRMKEKIFSFGVFELSRIIIQALFSIYLVVYLGYGENGPIISGILSSIIFLVVTIILLFKNKSVSALPKKIYINHALKFGLPLIPHTLFGALSTTVDKIIIASLLKKEELGIYAVGFAIGALIKSIEGSIYLAYQPWFFKEMSSDHCDNNKIVRLSYLIVAFLLVCSLAISLISKAFLHYYIGEEFITAIRIIPWVAFSFAINGMYTVVNQVLMYKEKTGIISIVTALSVGVGVLFNYYFIDMNGLIGAAQALLLLMTVRTITMWIYSNNLHPLGWFNLNKN
jgi:O-antigen/teichoic acid export membrane protein